MEIKVEQLKIFSSEVTGALNYLLVQLNPGSKILNDVDVKNVVENLSNRFFVARIDNKIIGMLTLIVVNTFSAKKGLFEDLVVDKNFQGRGIGTKLINEAIGQARKEGIVRIDFTSSPERIAANKLYESLGFKKRNTNIYRIDL
jgi:ribosomal protein S18 acetylase RimI-like enzyme